VDRDTHKPRNQKNGFFLNVTLGFFKVDRYHIANIKKTLIAFRN